MWCEQNFNNVLQNKQFSKKVGWKIQITGCNDASSFCVNHASNLHETPMLDLHPHYTQYVGRKLLYDFKGQTNIYLVKVSSKCEHYKTRLLLSIMNQVFLQGLGGGNLNKGIDLEFQWNAVVVIGLNL